MSNARRIALVVGLLVLALGAWVLVDWMNAKTIWPAEMSALEMPAPVFPADEAAPAAIEAAMAAVEGFDREAIAAHLDADGPLTTPADGWPVVPDDAAARYDAFVATTGWSAPLTRPDREMPDYFGLMTLNDVRLMRAMVRFVEGDRGGAWDDLLSAHTFAQRVQHAGGSLIMPMLGVALEAETMHLARRFLAADGWTPEARALGPALAAAAGRPSPLVAGLTAEALGFDALYAELGNASLEELMQTTEGGPPPETSGGGTVFYDADKTRALHRQYFAQLIAAAGQPAGERTPPAFPALWSDEWTALGQLVDNPVGRILLSIGIPAFTKYIERYDRHHADRSRLAIALAKAAWQADTGGAPPSVEALVPDYLPAVPVDAMTGQPLTLDPPPLPDDEAL